MSQTKNDSDDLERWVASCAGNLREPSSNLKLLTSLMLADAQDISAPSRSAHGITARYPWEILSQLRC